MRYRGLAIRDRLRTRTAADFLQLLLPARFQCDPRKRSAAAGRKDARRPDGHGRFGNSWLAEDPPRGETAPALAPGQQAFAVAAAPKREPPVAGQTVDLQGCPNRSALPRCHRPKRES